MAFSIVIFTLSVFLFTVNGKPAIDSRIVGGNPAEEKQFPYAAALFINKGTDTQNLCGGSLISPEYVLTAAHCIVLDTFQVTVVLGSIGIDEPTPHQVVMNSSEFIVPENYSTRLYDWDLALIKLPEPVTLNDYIQPITLAEGDDTFAGDTATVLGWGIKEWAQTKYDPFLRYTVNRIMSNEECGDNNALWKQIVLESHVCQSSAGDQAACRGDSGGPLVNDGIQVGIVSTGPGNCFVETPVIFTRITSFREWIKENSGV